VNAASCAVVRAAPSEVGVTGLVYAAGLSAETVGSRALCLQLVTIAPGARGTAHLHDQHESGIYVVSGEVVMWFGERLADAVVARPGDFVYIPAGAPHVPANYGDEPAVGVLARTDPNAQESVVLLPELDGLPQLEHPPARSA
jgi:uncharacterized RmlC-like cupin family protein